MEENLDMIRDIENIDWEIRLSERSKRITPSFLREILKLAIRPEIISFAGGLPAPEYFPIREFEEACHHILQTQGEIALQYSATEGYRPLKEFLAEKLLNHAWIREELDERHRTRWALSEQCSS